MLKQSDTGIRVDEICRKMVITEATFYAWKKKYGGLAVSELCELRQLKEENAKLKQMVSNLSLDKQMLQDVLKKSSEAHPAQGPQPLPQRQLRYLGSTQLLTALTRPQYVLL